MAEQEWVDMIAVRPFGFGADRPSVKAGDKISVPVQDKENGIYPVRWWEYHKKAARTVADAKKMAAQLPEQPASDTADAG